MATAAQIQLVRKYTNEPTQDDWTDQEISDLVDELGVSGATAQIWEEKAAEATELVDVKEAGASRSMSQAFEHAKKMAAYWRSQSASSTSGTKIHQIQRPAPS